MRPGAALLPPPPPGRRKPLSSGAVRVLPAPATDGTSARGREGARRRRDLLLSIGGLAVAACVAIFAVAANDDPIVPAVQPVPVATPQPLPPSPRSQVGPEQPAVEQPAVEQPDPGTGPASEAQPGAVEAVPGEPATEVAQ